MKARRQVIAREPFCWSDIYSLRFVVQVIFSGIILCFCFFQLSNTSVKDKNDALYWSCVSGILALWMPSPSSRSASSEEFYLDSNHTSHIEAPLEPPASDRLAPKSLSRFSRPLNGTKSDL